MLTFYPGVTSPVLHPISDTGPPNVIPAGTTFVKATRTAYLATAVPGAAGDITYVDATRVTYTAEPSPGGATIITHDDAVTLTVPGIASITTHLRPVTLTVPAGS